MIRKHCLCGIHQYNIQIYILTAYTAVILVGDKELIGKAFLLEEFAILVHVPRCNVNYNTRRLD